MRRIILILTMSAIAMARPFPTEYISAELSLFIQNQSPEALSDDLIPSAALASSIVTTTLEDLTGFALLLEGDLPEGTKILAEIFWSYDGANWLGPIHEWEIEENTENPGGHLFSNIYYTAKPPAMFYRANFYLYSKNGLSPRIDEASFVFMDCGWTEHEPQKVKSASSALWSMPAYIGRGPSGWNCPIPNGFATGTPFYFTTITHITIHHTAGATSTPSDPAAQMRNMWNYHVYTLGWSDIGYNYVLDHLGNIYQGRYNSDLANLDVRGSHTSYHNENTMGFSVMGNFDLAGVYINPPTWPAMFDLLAWKCSQRSIDPRGSAWNGTTGYEQYAPCILGHKDWTSASTACPGANFYPTIPSIRDTIYNRLFGGSSDSIIVDNGDAEFTTGGPWNVGTYAPELGWWGDYLWGDIGGEDNWAVWRPDIPEDGLYEVYMFWLAGSNRCDSVFVRVFGEANESLFVSQKGSGSAWHFLGLHNFMSGNTGYVSLSDRSAVDGSVVIADAVLWIYSGVLQVENQPAIPEKQAICAYPNPFNSAVKISVEKPLRLEVFDLNGRLVEQLNCDAREGSQEFVWRPGDSVVSGLYFVRAALENGHSATARIVFMK